MKAGNELKLNVITALHNIILCPIAVDPLTYREIQVLITLTVHFKIYIQALH